MSSSFWVGDGADSSDSSIQNKISLARRPPIQFAEDLEAVLLESLSANLYSFAGLDIFTRKMIKKKQESSLSLNGIRGNESKIERLSEEHSPHLLSLQLLPPDHPVRTQIEEIAQATGLPRHAALRRLTETPDDQRTNFTLSSLPSEPTATSTTTSHGSRREMENSRPGHSIVHSTSHAVNIGEDNDQQSSFLSSENVEGSEDGRGKVMKSQESAPPAQVAAPRSALARLVAQAKAVVPVGNMEKDSSASEEEESGDEEEDGLRSSSQSPYSSSSHPKKREYGSMAKPVSASLSVKRARTDSSLSLEEEIDEKRRKKEPEGEEAGIGLGQNQNGGVSPEGAKAHLSTSDNEGEGATETNAVLAKHPSQMTREEFLSQFKRAPRRGEIGLSAEEIGNAEKLGYVMSGSRSKAAHMFVNRVQRQLHERDAAKREQQFRQVEDERSNTDLIDALAKLVQSKVSGVDPSRRGKG